MTKGQPRACVCLNWPMGDLEDFFYDEEDDEEYNPLDDSDCVDDKNDDYYVYKDEEDDEEEEDANEEHNDQVKPITRVMMTMMRVKKMKTGTLILVKITVMTMNNGPQRMVHMKPHLYKV